MMNIKNYILGIVLFSYLGLLGYLYLGIGQKDTYPAKPISIIIHSKPGSAIDFMARKVAEIARKHSDAAFVVENRSGTQGLVAMQHVLDMKADGYALLGVTKSFLSTVMVNKSKVKLDDFLFVANMVSDPEALISNQERGFKSLDDIIRDSQRDEKQIWIGPGTGSRDHIMALKSWETLGLNANWIDYKSGPQSILAMLRDESAVYVGNPADILGKSNLDIISIASKKRLSSLPNVPTFMEQGFDLNESMWRGFAFKKGVPEKAVVYITAVLQKVVNDEEWEEYCNDTYVFSNFEKQDEFTRRIARETEETIYYLNKAGLLAKYVRDSPIHLLLVLLIIFSVLTLLILSINRFKISKISYDQIIAAGIFGFTGFFYYQTLLFDIPETANITSPTMIPRIWIITLAILSIVLFFRSNAIAPKKQNYSPKIVLIIILFLFIYLISMQWVGYFFTTPLFILATMYLLKYRKVPIMGIVSFGFVLFSYLIFNKLLNIDLPMGGWFV